MLRAAAAPERFLTRGFARFLSRAAPRTRRAGAPARVALGVVLPRDLAKLLDVVGDEPVGDFKPVRADASLASLLSSARRGKRGRARLIALLAGAVPFGETRSGELWVYFLGDVSGPARGVVAAVDPDVPSAPRLVCRGAGAFAYLCCVRASREQESPALPTPGVPEQEAIGAAFERARTLADVLLGDDPKIRSAARLLARRPLDVTPSPPSTRSADRSAPLALGSILESYLRLDASEWLGAIDGHESSADALVRELSTELARSLETGAGATARELARRRAIASAAARAGRKPARRGGAGRAELTRRIIASIEARPETGESLASIQAREEGLLALGEIGDRALLPGLLARAVTGDVAAVDMLAAFGDATVAPQLLSLLGHRERASRQLETAVVRALTALDARAAAPRLREMLADNPMASWREGLERGPLVRALVEALGVLEDAAAGRELVEVLESQSQEYRTVLPIAAWSVGRLRHLPALATLERLLCSPKEPVTCEAIWAVGSIAEEHEEARARAAALLDGLAGLEPGAEITRLAALAKAKAATAGAPRAVELRRALARALWEPAFRQEETSRRRAWALRALGELARLPHADKLRVDLRELMGREAVAHFLTRDDTRVRKAAEEAFSAWRVPLPTTRRYYSFALDDLQRRGGIAALHDAVRDPLGVFRHNVATRLAEERDPRSVRPLAEATARLFAEPPTSTYEYDDAPPHVVAFVRALARINRREGNDVLIEGLRSGHHQVRAVVAENAPEDERFVPELMAMLGDPRSFLRSRAEKSLASLGALPAAAGGATRIVEV